MSTNNIGGVPEPKKQPIEQQQQIQSKQVQHPNTVFGYGQPNIPRAAVNVGQILGNLSNMQPQVFVDMPGLMADQAASYGIANLAANSPMGALFGGQAIFANDHSKASRFTVVVPGLGTGLPNNAQAVGQQQAQVQAQPQAFEQADNTSQDSDIDYSKPFVDENTNVPKNFTLGGFGTLNKPKFDFNPKDLSNIQGSNGNDGANGADGANGGNGPDGADGADGADGNDGNGANSKQGIPTSIVVENGDTLRKIADRYGIDYKALKDANPDAGTYVTRNSDKNEDCGDNKVKVLMIGEELNIPENVKLSDEAIASLIKNNNKNIGDMTQDFYDKNKGNWNHPCAEKISAILASNASPQEKVAALKNLKFDAELGLSDSDKSRILNAYNGTNNIDKAVMQQLMIMGMTSDDIQGILDKGSETAKSASEYDLATGQSIDPSIDAEVAKQKAEDAKAQKDIESWTRTAYNTRF